MQSQSEDLTVAERQEHSLWEHAAEILNNLLTLGRQVVLEPEDVRMACAMAELELRGIVEHQRTADGRITWKKVN
jgi:hypothetical protein